MSDITISYKGSSIATMDATGSKTLLTEGKYCEGDITVDYVKPSGGDTVPIKDVVFWDYDGTPLYSYTETEANALTALPANPSHAGLTAQGWNWTLQDIKDQITECPGGTIDIGQSYVTDDGKTRIYIEIPFGTVPEYMTFYVRFRASAVGNTTIDWGDGTTETNTATSATNYAHMYSAAGSYMITLTVASGTIRFEGDGNNSIFGAIANGWNRMRIKKIELGNNIEKYASYSFAECYALKTITMPTSIVRFDSRVFQNDRELLCVVFPKAESYTFADYSLCLGGTQILRVVSTAKGMQTLTANASRNIHRRTVTKAGIRDNAAFADTNVQNVVFPTSGITEIKQQSFSGCSCLEKFVIPSTITAIGVDAFKYCYSLNGPIIIPAYVTTIGNSAFNNCISVLEYHVLPTTPPTLGGTSVFNGINANCKIYVPYSEDHSVLSAYQTASNWSTHASKMVEEPA